MQQLFDLAIGRLDLRNGLLLVNDRTLPLDFAADDVTAVMTYDHGDRRYDGTRAGRQDGCEVPGLPRCCGAGRCELQPVVQPTANQVAEADVGELLAAGQTESSPTSTIRSCEFKYSSALDVGQVGSVTAVVRAARR